jgi:single-strand DNA-binding protein
MNESDGTDTLANVAVLRGAVRGEPVTRVLPSGGVVVQFDVSTTVRSRGAVSNTSVPVAWVDPSSASMGCLVDGNELVVVGTVQRRFFRVGGATQSRTEVVAESVIPARRRKQVDAALEAVLGRLCPS